MLVYIALSLFLTSCAGARRPGISRIPGLLSTIFGLSEDRSNEIRSHRLWSQPVEVATGKHL
jgi:hypothetical protein